VRETGLCRDGIIVGTGVVWRGGCVGTGLAPSRRAQLVEWCPKLCYMLSLNLTRQSQELFQHPQGLRSENQCSTIAILPQLRYLLIHREKGTIVPFKEFRLTETGRPTSLRGLRIVWRALLVATVLYVWSAEKYHSTNKPISQEFYSAICIVSICLIGTMFLIQKRSAKQLEGSSSPADPKALRRAYAVQLSLMACALAVVLYGLVVRFVGATLAQALPFYIVGSSLLLYFRPKEIGTDAK